VYIFVERMIIVNRAAKGNDKFMERITNCIRQNKLDEAKNLCGYSDTPLSHMIGKGPNSLGKPLNDINT
ncbi:MAG: MotA/TolQ/ExbB proton channel family protein, partial [Bacteroidales bacterium]|nr:MotA/TolQ/ExbB proton channel family protein [Bacteroidales bacterium]